MSLIDNKREQFKDDHQAIISQTKKWVDTVIVRLNICPFAKAEVQAQRIDYHVEQANDSDVYLQHLMQKMQHLDADSDIATTLVIFADAQLDFYQYLDLVAKSEILLAEQGYEGIYQIASFHPDYCFGGSDDGDASNYTNRAPYPIIHLIREDDITKALQDFLRPEQIPERNIEFTQRKGVDYMHKLLTACYDAPAKNKQ